MDVYLTTKGSFFHLENFGSMDTHGTKRCCSLNYLNENFTAFTKSAFLRLFWWYRRHSEALKLPALKTCMYVDAFLKCCCGSKVTD